MIARGRPGRLAVWLIPALVLAVVAACGSSDTSGTGRSTALAEVKPVAAGTRISAVATTSQIADFLKNVAGDRVTIVQLVAAGQDPHEFEPKPADIQRLNASTIIFKNGAGLESSFTRFLNNLPKSVPIIDLSQGVKLRREGKTVDAHIWHDPLNARLMVDTIRDALVKLDPPNAAIYQQNATAYDQQLTQLDAQIRRLIDAVPAPRRKLVSNHDAFGYFVARYGIAFVGSVIPGVDTNTEPSSQEVAALVKKIQAQHVCAIFTETSVNPKLEQQIAADAGVKVYSNLYGDTLGSPGSDGDTYLKMELSNATNMVAGMTQSC